MKKKNRKFIALEDIFNKGKIQVFTKNKSYTSLRDITNNKQSLIDSFVINDLGAITFIGKEICNKFEIIKE